jgi:hypothetical protein
MLQVFAINIVEMMTISSKNENLKNLLIFSSLSHVTSDEDIVCNNFDVRDRNAQFLIKLQFIFSESTSSMILL